jgi:hypothetical protein
MVGEETAFFLSAQYPSALSVLFPDSSHNFEPLEYQRKRYFATQTSNGLSYDSTVYYLTTFELDSAQVLSLPVYLLSTQDCTVYTSNRDTIGLIHLVAAVPDSISAQELPLKLNTAYHKVNFQFNIYVLIIAGAVLVLLTIAVWFVFGKRIRRYFTLKNLKKRHKSFIQQYDQTALQIQKSFSSTTTEKAVILWKKYMEQLESRPYTKLTTRETIPLLQDEALGKSLMNIDRAIYGYATTVLDSLTYLRTVADQQFTKKIQEVNHGK